jgi:hypothetical protein
MEMEGEMFDVSLGIGSFIIVNCDLVEKRENLGASEETGYFER